MEKFWMMVLAVIVAVLLMNLVVNPLMNMFGVKEGMYQPDCPYGNCSPAGTHVIEGPANTNTKRWNPLSGQMEYQ